MAVSVRIIESVPQIKEKIFKALFPDVLKYFESRKFVIEEGFTELIRNKFIASDTYRSLTTGRLWFEFGFSDPVGFATQVIVELLRFLDVKVIASKGDSRFGRFLNLKAIAPAAIDELISSPNASYPSKGGPVNWLEWLLTRGTQEVVATHYIKFGNFKTSRSGGALMAKLNSKKTGVQNAKAYSVSPSFAGTPNDNWITKTLQTVTEQEVEQIFSKIF